MSRGIAPAREAAFQTLRAIAEGGADLGDALSRARDPLADPRDRALATELATGTLRWRGALDYQLQLRSARPLPALDPAVLDALRLGAYQILYLERVPASAAVNDAVEIVKREGVRSAAPFVNAILRRLARERQALAWPPRAPLADHLAVTQSHPVWLVQRWLARYGEHDTERWLRFNNDPPSLTLAANRLLCSREELAHRLEAEGVTTTPAPVAPHGLIVQRGRPLDTAAYRDGLFLVQDEASQLISELLQVQPGDRVFDACASPGGKTVAAAAVQGPDGMVVATDVRARRVRLLASTLARCRATHVHVLRVSPAQPLPFADGVFTRVLVDAPCSGLGTVRRDPDIRWRRGPDDLPALAAAQRALLERVAPLVAPGGRLVYSTCSSEPDENEAVVHAFLRDATEFRAVPLAEAQPGAALVQMQTPDGFLRTTPLHGLEAFFGAILERRGPGARPGEK